MQARQAQVDLGPDLRRIRVNAGALQVESRPLGMLGVAGGVGPVRHSVAAHAPGEVPEVVPGPLQRGLAWLGAAREQVPAGTLGCLELGVADPELLRSLLHELSAPVWVRVVRHAVRAHAAGEGQCSFPSRRRRGVRGVLRCGRAELRPVTPWRAAQCRRRKGEPGGRDDGSTGSCCLGCEGVHAFDDRLRRITAAGAGDEKSMKVTPRAAGRQGFGDT
jgi:hypothetical protein